MRPCDHQPQATGAAAGGRASWLSRHACRRRRPSNPRWPHAFPVTTQQSTSPKRSQFADQRRDHRPLEPARRLTSEAQPENTSTSLLVNRQCRCRQSARSMSCGNGIRRDSVAPSLRVLNAAVTARRRTGAEVQQALAVGGYINGEGSRRRDCHFDDTSLFIPIVTPNKGAGGCHQMTVSPTARRGQAGQD